MVDSENLCRKAMEIYGFPAQAAMVVEECSELTNAICKFRRGRQLIKKQIREELRNELQD